MASDDRVVVEFDQHITEYRETYPAKAHELREQCPVVWSSRHDGFWVVTGHEVLSAISKRTDLLSNDHDPAGERNGYQGISIPERGTTAAGSSRWTRPSSRSTGASSTRSCRPRP